MFAGFFLLGVANPLAFFHKQVRQGTCLSFSMMFTGCSVGLVGLVGQVGLEGLVGLVSLLGLVGMVGLVGLFGLVGLLGLIVWVGLKG